MENELGRFLEELRGKNSLREAAKKSGLSHTYIRDLELGINRKTKAPIRPSADTLKQLASAYGYPSNELLKKAGYIEEESTSKQPEDFNPLEELTKHIERLGIKDMGFADIEKWKTMSREDIEQVVSHFEFIVSRAKERQQKNKD